jgi:predicted extracellular nuclease
VLEVLSDLPSGHETVKSDIAMIQQSFVANAAQKGSVRNPLRMGDQHIFNRAIIPVLGQLFQQMCGTSITVAYAVSISRNTWASTLSSPVV